MKQTQINGETYVRCEDVCDWLMESSKAADTLNQSDYARVFKHIADDLRVWANDPERKRGMVNTIMKVQ